jgi:two-component system, chemotaxis family, protein-glutamate methylesterase/glutaminase
MIRVLVVDDSTVVRRMLSDALDRDPDIEVVGTAVDPYDAREKVIRLAPDVMTLDIEMPRMDGLSFLARLMKHHPIPVVIVSSLAPKNSAAALRALELGAVEVIGKPGPGAPVRELAGPLARAIRAAAAADPSRMPRRAPGLADPSAQVRPAMTAAMIGAAPGARRVLAIGASTGGPVALEQVLGGLPAGGPGVLIVQHMPAAFTAAFARRLGDRCAMQVREATAGDAVVPGLALVAPGGRHMVLLRRDKRLVVDVRDGPPVQFQRPSVDVLFHSVAQVAGSESVGILLTGMGSDGASGMRALRDAGAHTIAQDEATSVVFSMPKEAIRFDGACEVLPLQRIAAAALRAACAPIAHPQVRTGAA